MTVRLSIVGRGINAFRSTLILKTIDAGWEHLHGIYCIERHGWRVGTSRVASPVAVVIDLQEQRTHIDWASETLLTTATIILSGGPRKTVCSSMTHFAAPICRYEVVISLEVVENTCYISHASTDYLQYIADIYSKRFSQPSQISSSTVDTSISVSEATSSRAR